MASLHELFQWSIEQQTAHGNTSNQATDRPPRQLTEMDRAFLEAAIRTDASKMKGLLDIYTNPVSSEEAKEVALEELEFFVQTIDNASENCVLERVIAINSGKVARDDILQRLMEIEKEKGKALDFQMVDVRMEAHAGM